MQVEDIVAKAQAVTGSSDMGAPSPHEGLERLVAASNAEARFSEIGATGKATNIPAPHNPLGELTW